MQSLLNAQYSIIEFSLHSLLKENSLSLCALDFMMTNGLTLENRLKLPTSFKIIIRKFFHQSFKIESRLIIN